jgi:spermidine synthase
MVKGTNPLVNILNVVAGKKVLFQGNSPFNGAITVTQDIFGKYLLASGLTQSGEMIESLWRTAISKVKGQKVERILVLGLGAGSCLIPLTKKWPQAEIAGVEIDPKMIQLGKKFFRLSDYNLEIKIEDAINFVSKTQQKFDLVLIDLFSGEKYPKFSEEQCFLKNLKKILEKNGLLIFNRLYFEFHRKLSDEFLIKLKKYFVNVNPSKFPRFFPTNLLIFCQN